MARKVNSEKQNTPRKKSNKSNVAKLKVLITIVNKSKATYYLDLLEEYEINMQMVVSGRGTADSEMLNLLGLAESDKAVIISVVKEDKVKDVLETLKEKFNKVKNGKGIAYTIPMESVIGVSIYQFLIYQILLKMN